MLQSWRSSRRLTATCQRHLDTDACDDARRQQGPTVPILQVLGAEKWHHSSKTGIWKHLLSAQPIWLPVFPPGLCSPAVSTACIWAPSCLCSGANQLVSPKKKPRHDWQAAFSRVAQTEKPVISWTRLYLGQSSKHLRRPHAHWPSRHDAEHTTPSCPSVDVQFWQCLSLPGEFQTSTKKRSPGCDHYWPRFCGALQGAQERPLPSVTMACALQRVLGGVDASQSVAMSLHVIVTSEAFSTATTRTEALPGSQHSQFSSP